MKKIIFLILILFSIKSNASLFWLGMGNSTHNFLSAQSDKKGSKKSFDLGPTVLLGFTVPFLTSGTFLSPGIGYAKYFTKDKTSKSDIIIQYHLNQYLFSNIYLRYGFSNYITSIGGDGGTTTLNNGSSTSTFYIPSETKKSYTASFDIGSEYLIDNTWTFRMQVSIERFLSSTNRKVGHLLTLNYFF